MRYFVVKTSDTALVNLFQNGNDEIELDGLNSYDDVVTPGLPLFLVFGGDRVPWKLGTVAVCKTLTTPYAKGYNREKPKDYKLKVKIAARFPRTLAKSDFKYYEGTEDNFIGIRTKGERNQALLEIPEKNALVILRAVIDYFPELEEKILPLLDNTAVDSIKKDVVALVQQLLPYGQTPFNAASKNNKRAELKNRNGGENLLLYGVPGCGKSYTIAERYCNDDNFMERVVFHPDYTYSDFAGQILPAVNPENGNLEYAFTAGPFTRIMKKAYDDPENMYYLIIEEINRGNAPAIFGDIFQLLDRDTDGVSMYGVTNSDIAGIIYSGDYEQKIKLPGNLTILATMNTSDQSVFTLDTAFKRRWNMKMIPNRIENAAFAHKTILNTNVTWYQFATAVNELIASENSGITGTGDKRLGTYFISEQDISMINNNGQEDYNPAFAEKVIMYLWNDVFVYNRETIFDPHYTSLDSLLEGFKNYRFGVFNLEFGEEESGE